MVRPRWLGILEDATDASGPLRAFRRFLLLHACARSWLWLAFAVDVSPAGLAVAALLTTFAFALVWLPHFERRAPVVALPALALQLALTFPSTDNHFFVELLALGLLCLVEPGGSEGREEDATLLAALRWLAVIVLFHTGLQKVLYGQYFGGEFLAYMVGRGERFATFFQWLLPAAEVARLQSYDPLQTGAGPYRVTGTAGLPFLLASNGVWIAELSLPALLGWRRTRRVTAGAAIAFVLMLQLAAREAGFALLFANLLLLFTASGNRRVLPWIWIPYALALAAAAGLLPGSRLFDPGWL